ncbi:MAG TPA: hypothetical protein VHE35_04305 [Kofleriaceae bacterium]|nr:hypothetical protein [Kofleriaceae bacterium]
MTAGARSIARVGVCAAACALAAGACKGEGPGGEHIARARDAGAAVVIVDRPAGGGGGGAFSDLPPEREPNAKPADASPIGDGVQGVLDGDTDVDAFVVQSPGPRMLTAALSPIEGIDTRLELRDKEFNVIATSERGGAGIGEGLADAPLDKGTYYLVVREVPRPPAKAAKKAPKPKPGTPAPAPAAAGRVGRSPPYTLTARLVADPAPGAEREPDDDAGSANDVSLIEPVTGHLGWTGDVDVWKVPLEGLAAGNGLDVTISAIPGTTLTLAVTDAADRPRTQVTGVPGQPLTLRSLAPRLDPGQAPFHHLKIGGKPSNPDVAYTLTVTPRLLDLDEEAEPNDKPQTATPLRYGADEQGSMRGELGPGEVDVFELSPSSGPRTLDATIDSVAGLDLVCEIVSSTGAALGGKGDGGGVGAGEDCSGAVPTGAEAYVRVSAKASKKPQAQAAYTLRWSSSGSGGAPPPAAGSDDPLPPEE